MGAEPIRLHCPMCERYVSRIEQARDYGKYGQNVTIWHHGGDWCFIVDDIYQQFARSPETPFSTISVEPAR